jgi:hypothetical protein
MLQEDGNKRQAAVGEDAAGDFTSFISKYN